MSKVDVLDTIENLLGSVGNRVDAFSRKPLHVDIVDGLAAALSLSFLAAMLNLLGDHDKKNFGFILSFLLLSSACYLTPVLLLHLTKLRSLKRFLPSCIFIAVFGSLLLICSFPGYQTVESVMRSELPLGEALKEKFWDGVGGLAVLSLLVLPVVLIVHYSGAIVRAIVRWHNGADSFPKIVG